VACWRCPALTRLPDHRPGSQLLINLAVVPWLAQLAPWAVPVLLIVIWQLLSQSGVIASQVMPAPRDVLRATIRTAQSGELLRDLAISSARALSGFAIGAVSDLSWGCSPLSTL